MDDERAFFFIGWKNPSQFAFRQAGFCPAAAINTPNEFQFWSNCPYRAISKVDPAPQDSFGSAPYWASGHIDHGLCLTYGQNDHTLPEIVMGMLPLGRSDFCRLAGLEIEQYNALRRRGQLPSMSNRDLPREMAGDGGFSPGGALLLIMANELTERYEMSRECAARIATCGLQAFRRWGDVFVTSAQVAAGKEPTIDVLLGVINWPGVARDKTKNRPLQKIAVGTLEEIAQQHPDAHDIVAISLTRCAALLRQRAAKAQIDLGDFWAMAGAGTL